MIRLILPSATLLALLACASCANTHRMTCEIAESQDRYSGHSYAGNTLVGDERRDCERRADAARSSETEKEFGFSRFKREREAGEAQ